jgi:hypothetical protein
VSDRLVELRLAHVNEGKLVQRIDRAIRQAVQGLKQFELDSEQTGKGKASVSVSIEVKRVGVEKHFGISYAVNVKTPTMRTETIAKESADGRAICRPEGSAHDSPDQGLLFNERGEVVGGVDPDTGEVIDPALRGVAGKVGKAASGA